MASEREPQPADKLLAAGASRRQDNADDEPGLLIKLRDVRTSVVAIPCICACAESRSIRAGCGMKGAPVFTAWFVSRPGTLMSWVLASRPVEQQQHINTRVARMVLLP